MRPTLADVKQAIHALNVIDLHDDQSPPVEFSSNVRWDFRTPWDRPIHHIASGPLLKAMIHYCRKFHLAPVAILLGMMDTFLRAVRLWWASRQPRSVILLNMGESVSLLFGILRLLWPTPGKVIASHIYLHRWSWWKRTLVRWSMRSTSVCAVWSNHQVAGAEELLGKHGPTFLKVPYKANHSQLPPEPPLPVGDYVFSGGNTERDYRTLFEALDGTTIPVVVSCTDPAVLQGLTIPANVLVVAAREPSFRRLMAGARLVVLCIRPGILRGAGEATFLNAMWHGRPVVVADDGAAPEYIEDGATGYVVGSGDVEGLRRCVVRLWDDRELRDRIGRAGRNLVEREYTGQRWRERMMKLALLLIDESEREKTGDSPLASSIPNARPQAARREVLTPHG